MFNAITLLKKNLQSWDCVQRKDLFKAILTHPYFFTIKGDQASLMLHKHTLFDDLGGCKIEFLLVFHEIPICEYRNLSEVKIMLSDCLFTFSDDESENIAQCMRSR